MSSSLEKELFEIIYSQKNNTILAVDNFIINYNNILELRSMPLKISYNLRNVNQTVILDFYVKNLEKKEVSFKIGKNLYKSIFLPLEFLKTHEEFSTLSKISQEISYKLKSSKILENNKFIDGYLINFYYNDKNYYNKKLVKHIFISKIKYIKYGLSKIKNIFK